MGGYKHAELAFYSTSHRPIIKHGVTSEPMWFTFKNVDGAKWVNNSHEGDEIRVGDVSVVDGDFLVDISEHKLLQHG